MAPNPQRFGRPGVAVTSLYLASPATAGGNLTSLRRRHAPGLRVARVAAIPYAEDRPSSPKGYPEEPISPPMTSPPRASILIVDDSRETRDIYAEYLSYFGYCVGGVGSAGEALETIRSVQPDVVVIDLTLPGMDGYEATRRLRADADTRDLRIIMLTGHLLRGSRQAALAAGVDAFLTKPCLPEDLLTAIEAVLRRPSADATSA